MGFALFIPYASFICVNATSLEMMVIGRILQGLVFRPRTISIAIIRDMYSGDYMAHHVICDGCFILVPVIVRLWVNAGLLQHGFSIFR
jgi:DHA1 family bicyclomycin/chloramphenicol resistance-like MFS transporter